MQVNVIQKLQKRILRSTKCSYPQASEQRQRPLARWSLRNTAADYFSHDDDDNDDDDDDDDGDDDDGDDIIGEGRDLMPMAEEGKHRV